MEPESILFPIIALVALTFGIGLWFGAIRFRAVRTGDINPAYYILNRGAKLPEYYLKVNNNYNNLFEIPLLFYVVSVLIYVTNKTDFIFLILSWMFVATRYLHSYIHTTYNNLTHRRNAFLSGIVILMFEWIRFSICLL